jgi:MFS transporter, UMF1 family
VQENDASMTPASRLGQFSWALYDWANSAFSAVIVTFVFATYFSQGIAENPTVGTAQWGWAMTASGIAIALTAPILGAVADAVGRRKPWLFGFTWGAIAGCFALWYARPEVDYVLYALVVVALTNFVYEIAQVFYNAMLPEIAGRERIGRISGWSWGLGYFGGLVCLTFTLFAFVHAETPLFGLSREDAENVRIVGPLVGAWYLVFSLPLLLFTPDRDATGRLLSEAVRDGLAKLWHTVRNVRHYREIAKFLIARLFYTEGLNTLFLFGGIYAAGTFGMDMAQVVQFGILLNITAGLGAFAFGWIDDWIGAKRTILIALACLMLFGLAAVLVTDPFLFWIIGAGLGLFVGPAQAASRSLMARIAPEDVRTEMFGLYALSGKITAYMGPFVLGTVTYLTNSQRLGVATILLFWLVGALLLLTVRDPDRPARST